MIRVLLGELAASAALLLLLPGVRQPVFAFAAWSVSSAIGAATVTWVLAIRFEAIDASLRPMALSYIRTFLWTASPVGGLLAGFLWRPLGAPALLVAAAGLAGLAALVGLHLQHRGGQRVHPARRAHGHGA